MKTFNEAIDDAVKLLSTHTFASLGECSASKLIPCGKPTPFALLYIAELEKLRQDGGDYADGMAEAIRTLGKYEVGRSRQLVEVDAPPQYMSLYISRLQAMK